MEVLCCKCGEAPQASMLAHRTTNTVEEEKFHSLCQTCSELVTRMLNDAHFCLVCRNKRSRENQSWTRTIPIDFDESFKNAQVQLVINAAAAADDIDANEVIEIEFCSRKTKLIFCVLISSVVAALVTVGVLSGNKKI